MTFVRDCFMLYRQRHKKCDQEGLIDAQGRAWDNDLEASHIWTTCFLYSFYLDST